MKKSLLILPIAVIALGVTTSCNLNSSESDYFKDTTIKEYEKYFQFNDKEYAPLDVGLANYVAMESAANFYKVNKVTNSYCHATRASAPDVADSLADLRTAKELEKNEYVANLVNQKASDVFSTSTVVTKDEEQKLKAIKTGLSAGFESYELFSNDVIEYVSEDNIYVLNEDNTQTLVDSEKEKDTYWYQLEDGVANVYTQYEGEKYGISVKHHNKYSTLEVESQEEASRELKYYFNNLVIGYAEDALSSYGDSLNYAYTNNDDIYIVSRMEGKVIESSTNVWIEQYLSYLNKQMSNQQNPEMIFQIKKAILAITSSGVYYVNNPLKPMTAEIMYSCGLDYSKFLSYFLPCIPVSMSVIKISKHDFGWGVDYNAWKSQLLLIKNEKDEVLSSPIAYTSYYDISEVTYKAPSSHVNMVYDEKLEMNNPFNIRLKIWEMMDYGEDRNQEEHPDRYVIDEENPFADEIAYSDDKASYINNYNRIYDYTSFYWQAYSDLEENKIRVYSGYIDFRRLPGKDYIANKEQERRPAILDSYTSYPVFSLEIVDPYEYAYGFVGYNDIPASNLGKQNNDYFACPLDAGSEKRIVSNISQVSGYQVTFYVDADPTHEDTFGQIIDYKYQEGLTISSVGGLRQQEQAIEILPGIKEKS